MYDQWMKIKCMKMYACYDVKQKCGERKSYTDFLYSFNTKSVGPIRNVAKENRIR